MWVSFSWKKKSEKIRNECHLKFRPFYKQLSSILMRACVRRILLTGIFGQKFFLCVCFLCTHKMKMGYRHFPVNLSSKIAIINRKCRNMCFFCCKIIDTHTPSRMNFNWNWRLNSCVSSFWRRRRRRKLSVALVWLLWLCSFSFLCSFFSILMV